MCMYVCMYIVLCTNTSALILFCGMYIYAHMYLRMCHSHVTVCYIIGPGKTDISAVPNMYQTINGCYGKGAATVNT